MPLSALDVLLASHWLFVVVVIVTIVCFSATTQPFRFQLVRYYFLTYSFECGGFTALPQPNQQPIYLLFGWYYLHYIFIWVGYFTALSQPNHPPEFSILGGHICLHFYLGVVTLQLCHDPNITHSNFIGCNLYLRLPFRCGGLFFATTQSSTNNIYFIGVVLLY